MADADRFSRRRFLRQSILLGASLAVPWKRGRAMGDPLPELTVAKGGSPAANCLAAVAALGGFSRFVHPGDRVVIKANPTGTSRPEAAISTHPDLVAAVVRACREAGAAQVLVASHDEMRSFNATGIAAAVKEAGGTIDTLKNRRQYREVIVSRGHLLQREAIAIPVLEADVFINMPIVKQSPEVWMSAALKNLMGVNWDRLRFHRTDLNQGIAELAGAVRHDLVIADANHVLLTNGPMGPGEVMKAGQVIAGTDPVAVDAFSARFLNRTPESVPAVRIAHELGIGRMDLAALRIQEVSA
jgi:uncharacterized protein (DUF362 family)